MALGEAGGNIWTVWGAKCLIRPPSLHWQNFASTTFRKRFGLRAGVFHCLKSDTPALPSSTNLHSCGHVCPPARCGPRPVVRNTHRRDTAAPAHDTAPGAALICQKEILGNRVGFVPRPTDVPIGTPIFSMLYSMLRTEHGPPCRGRSPRRQRRAELPRGWNCWGPIWRVLSIGVQPKCAPFTACWSA